jgi:DNA-binding NarL/FixJ family response regulator
MSHTSRTRIVIVEDDEIFRAIMTRYFQAWGYSVVAACGNGRDGLIQIIRLKPTLALIDIDLSVYNGLDVAAAIRKKVPEVMQLILTSQASDEMIQRAIQLNVDGVLDKNVDSFDHIKLAMSKVFAGEKYYSHTVKECIAAALHPQLAV